MSPTLRWQFEDLPKFVRWWNSLMDATQDVQLVSWFQLTIQLERKLNVHFHYRSSAKRWDMIAGKGEKNLVQRANSFSRVIQGLYTQQQSANKILHIRPASCAISFWTLNVWRYESRQTFCSSQTNCSWKVRISIDRCEHCALSISPV